MGSTERNDKFSRLLFLLGKNAPSNGTIKSLLRRPTAIYMTIFLLFSSSSMAVQILVHDDQGRAILNESQPSMPSESLGAFTVRIFEKYLLGSDNTFEGDEQSIISINGLTNDMKQIGPNELRAYGWCFSLDYLLPSTMPGETLIPSDSSIVDWYYGFMIFKDGIWGEECIPAWKQKQP